MSTGFVQNMKFIAVFIMRSILFSCLGGGSADRCLTPAMGKIKKKTNQNMVREHCFYRATHFCIAKHGNAFNCMQFAYKKGM